MSVKPQCVHVWEFKSFQQFSIEIVRCFIEWLALLSDLGMMPLNVEWHATHSPTRILIRLAFYIFWLILRTVSRLRFHLLLVEEWCVRNIYWIVTFVAENISIDSLVVTCAKDCGSVACVNWQQFVDPSPCTWMEFLSHSEMVGCDKKGDGWWTVIQSVDKSWFPCQPDVVPEYQWRELPSAHNLINT